MHSEERERERERFLEVTEESLNTTEVERTYWNFDTIPGLRGMAQDEKFPLKFSIDRK